jgi:tetratricopeptide (TPR) repeat protein
MSEGIRLRTSGIRGRGVLAVDNIGAKIGFSRDLERFCTTPVIASIRASEWRPGVWYEIRIEPEDQRPKLREMFISMLKANEVKYTEEAIDEIMKRDPTPVFLSTVAEDFKEKKMSIEDVSRIPKDLYEYIAKVINESGDDLAAAILYCIAKTKTGWLYREQLEILRKLLKKKRVFKGSGRYEKLLAKLNESFGIRHDVWRDVITLDTERLPESLISSAEMDVVRRIWKYGEGLTRLTKEACKESLNRIKNMKASDAANLAKRALENFPDLSEYAFRIALEVKEDKRDFILDMIAIEAPEPLMNIEIDEAEKLAYEIMRGPNVKIVLFGRLYSHYRDLASRDERYLPNLAKTLTILGGVLVVKGMLDDGINKLEEAIRIHKAFPSEEWTYLPNLALMLSNLGGALLNKGMLDDAIERYEEALKVLEPLSDRPWLWDLISGCHIGIALSLLEGDKKGAAEHLCTALKMLTDERAPETLTSKWLTSKWLLEVCISYLKEIPEELIPEECREKLFDILHRQSQEILGLLGFP